MLISYFAILLVLTTLISGLMKIGIQKNIKYWAIKNEESQFGNSLIEYLDRKQYLLL